MNKIRALLQNSYAHYAVLTLFVLAVNIQAFKGASLMHDAMNIYLPWAHWVTEQITEWSLPIWKIYQKGGFPQGIDPGSWYPFIWIWSLWGGFDAQAMSWMYLLHVWLLTLGTYKVLRMYTVFPLTSVFGALLFAVNGMVLGNAQHLGYIISITWGVWMFYALKVYVKERQFKFMVLFVLCSYLALTGGYPGFTISFFYLFLILYICLDYTAVKALKLPWKDFGWAAIGLLLLVLPFLYMVVTYSDVINRGGALPLDDSHWGVLSGSSTWQSYITLAMPFSASIQSSDFWQVDQSMAINYISLVGLIFTVIGLSIKEIRSKISIWVAVGIFFGLLSMATLVPIRSVLYYVLPLFDYFRFSAIFRVFFLFCMVVSSSMSLDLILQKNIRFNVKWGLALLPIIGFSVIATQLPNFNPQKLNWDVFNLLLSCLIVVVWVARNTTLKLLGSVLMVIQLGWNVSAYETTFVWRAGKAITVDKFIAAHKNKEIQNTPFSQTQDEALRKVTTGTYVNIATVTHQLSLDGYGPYVLTQFEREWIKDKEGLLASSPFQIDLGAITDIKAIANGVELQIENGQGNLAWIQNYHPHWTVVNNPELKVEADERGFCRIHLPEAYSGTLRIQFRDTGLTRWAMVSAVGSILFLIFAFVRIRRQRKTNDND